MRPSNMPNISFQSDEVYHVKDPQLKQYIIDATNAFELYRKDQNDFKSLTYSIEKYQSAIDYAIQNSVRMTDTAYCYRKCATVLVRDQSVPIEERNQKAKEYFAIAINYYKKFLQLLDQDKVEFFPNFQKVIRLELQRSLAFQCHVALNLKDGKLLLESAVHLLSATNQLPNPQYRFDALTYIYIVQFVSRDFDKAKQTLQNILKYQQSNNLDSSTSLRQLAKFNLASFMLHGQSGEKKEFFETQVQNIFWQVFDQHKQELTTKLHSATQTQVNVNRENFQLMKDFALLLMMKLVQRLNGIKDKHPDETICDYMVRQIHTVYGKQHQAKFVSSQEKAVRRRLYTLLKEAEQTEKIYLSSKLFDGVEPPEISVSKENFKQHLSDYSKVLLPDQELSDGKEEESEDSSEDEFFAKLKATP